MLGLISNLSLHFVLTLCLRAMKALVRLCGCMGLSWSSLIEYAISYWFIGFHDKYKNLVYWLIWFSAYPLSAMKKCHLWKLSAACQCLHQ